MNLPKRTLILNKLVVTYISLVQKTYLGGSIVALNLFEFHSLEAKQLSQVKVSCQKELARTVLTNCFK